MKKGVYSVNLKKVLIIMVIILLFLSFKSFGKTISREEYYNKTLAMILGQFAGTLSGLEFLYDPDNPGKAWIAIPDQYYIPLGGTLGGGTLQTRHATRLPQDGLMLSDDDEHVDFFNQWIMDKHGPGAARIDWRNKWLEYDVSDFGAGYDGMKVMKNDKLLPPYTGMGEYGNPGHWLPEGYIENDSMGSAFPGMPITAMRYTDMSATTIADFDPVLWGQFWAAAYAIAYFETDARTAMDKAAQLLPPDSWPKEVYDLCVSLKNQNSDWRVSVRTMWNSHRDIYAVWEEKGHMELSDVNNGFGVLAILYAGNNYEEAMKIASLSGADAECTAASVCGLLGIIHGMEGTPQYIKDRIYKNGEGIYRNDKNWFAFIRGDYPTDQKITELAATYQRNAERTIRAYGGTVTSTSYEIPEEPGMTPSYIHIRNNDFEEGNLSNWTKWSSIGSSGSIWAERQVNSSNGASFSHTGLWKGTILTAPDEEAKLYVTVEGLKPGSTYRIDGWIRSAGGRECRLYAENSDGYIYSSKFGGAFDHRWIYFTAGSDPSLNLGLHAPLTSTSGSRWCSIDDISIKEVFYDPGTKYEAENAVFNDARIVNSNNASQGKYVGYINTPGSSYVEFQNIEIPFSGQKVIRIYYANNDAIARQALSIDSSFIGNIKYPTSGEWGVFNQNFNEAVVWMSKGTHTVRLTADINFAEIDYIEVATYDEYRPNVDYDIRWGGVYRITAVHSNKSLEVPDSSYDNLTQVVQNDYNGSTNQQFRLDYVSAGCYRITPMHSDKCIEVEGWSTENGGRIVQYDYFGNPNQQWAILNMNNGLFKIVNLHSGKSLDISGGRLNNGTTAIQWDYLGLNNQLWKIEPYDQISQNINPVINITSPSTNQSFIKGENITINADAADSDGSVSLVEFYVDSVKIGEDAVSPYSISWNNASEGSHTITAAVTDNEGAKTVSDQINITVIPEIINAISIPGTFEAEDYDNGGEGISYSDSDLGNNGDAYRNDNVDIEICNEGGYNVGWIAEDEWLNYSIDVQKTDTYKIVLRTARDMSGTDGTVSISIDGTNVTGNITVPDTGGWQNWTNITSNISLTEGSHILTINMESDGFNINNISIINDNNTNIPPTSSITSPQNRTVFTLGDIITITANADDPDGSVTLVEFYADSEKIGEDSSAPYSITWSNATIGDYNIKAISTDNEGAQTVSEQTTITVSDNNQSDINVDYIIVNDWGSGFTGEITITNNSDTALNSWTLDFSFPGNQQITNGWNGTFTQSGHNVSIAGLNWNNIIQPGQSVTIGFNGNYSGTNQKPETFLINGNPVE